jgi:hypothetical protein
MKAHFGGAKKYISLMNLLCPQGGKEVIIVIARIAGSRTPKQRFIAIFYCRYGCCRKENPLPITEEDLYYFMETYTISLPAFV